jgi:hypothetical protein
MQCFFFLHCCSAEEEEKLSERSPKSENENKNEKINCEKQKTFLENFSAVSVTQCLINLRAAMHGSDDVGVRAWLRLFSSSTEPAGLLFAAFLSLRLSLSLYAASTM